MPNVALPAGPWIVFISRLLEFVAREPGRDGDAAGRVDHLTARQALETAASMQAVAPVPFVTPTSGGALLLQWDFRDGTSVEIYFDGEGDFPEHSALTRGGVVYEIDLAGPASLRALLQDRGPVARAGQASGG